MTITVTGKAADHIQKALKDKGCLGLRLGVKEVGCSGLTYTFDYAESLKTTDKVFVSKNVSIVVDEKNLIFLKGSVLDFEKKGLIFSALSPDGTLPEIIELKGHPWFVGVQFHPEFKSRPFTPHPLFSSFVKAANNRRTN